MKERPILFSGPMVRAIIDGRKTQTRRVVKPQAPAGYHIGSCPYVSSGWAIWNGPSEAEHQGCTCNAVRNPYGFEGDRLWVREAWRFSGWCPAEYSELGGTGMAADIEFAADGGRRTVRHPSFDIDRIHTSGRPSIHMPRWASRLTLEITGIRVERLNDCSEPDAMAEGWPGEPGDMWPLGWYRDLWNTINGADAWEANPWVWVVEFKPTAGAKTKARHPKGKRPMSEHLLLKWGTLKGWRVESDAAKDALQKYADAGSVSGGAMTQHDNDDQKQAICELIDALDGPITNDWSGEAMTKDEAKNYVLNYGAGR